MGWGMRPSCLDMRVWPMDIDIDIELLRSMKEDNVLWSTNRVDRESWSAHDSDPKKKKKIGKNRRNMSNLCGFIMIIVEISPQ